MNINKIIKKCLYNLFMTLVPWAILSRIAYAANGELESVDDINIINEKVNNALDLARKTEQTADKVLLQVNDILGISLDLWIYILLGICLFIILGMIFLLNQRANDIRVLNNKIRGIEREIDKLKRSIETFENEKNKTKTISVTTINKPTKEIFDYKTNNEFLGRNDANETLQNQNMNLVQKEFEQKQSKKEQEDEFKELRMKYMDFVNKYNNLYRFSGYEAKQKRKTFEQDFNIRTFTCNNYEKRIDELSDIRESYSEPTFKDSGSDGVYWATFMKDNMYAVVPRFNITYENQLHEMAGMKEAFNSDYKNEGAYKYIKVIKPAFFSYLNGNWKLEEQGKLELRKQ